MRNEIDFTVSDDGRDKGKVFHLKEMPASKAEKWAMRALFALGKSNIDIPAGIESMGWQGIATIGVQALMKMPFDDAEPLLDEMLECVTIKPDSNNPNIERKLVEDDIEEIRTRVDLRWKVINLHINFSSGGVPSTSTSDRTEMTSPSSNTKTFPVPSPRSSHPGKRR